MNKSTYDISCRSQIGAPAGETGWLYRQIYLEHPGAGASAATLALGDTLLTEWIGLWATEALRQHWSDSFFFIRYGEGGYHIRLRLHGSLADLHGPLLARLDLGLLEFFSLHAASIRLPAPRRSDDLYTTGFIRPAAYEPELSKYGGPAGMRLAEQHFFASSQLCLRILAAERMGGPPRSAYALELIQALLEAYRTTPAEQALLLHSHTDHWLRMLPSPQREQIAIDLERHYGRQRERLAQRRGKLQGSPDHAAVFQNWRDHLADQFAQLQTLERNGDLRSPIAGHLATFSQAEAAARLSQTPITSFVIVPNYLHLMLNRLGLNMLQEIQLAYLLYRGLEDDTRQPSASLPFILEPT